MRKIIYVIGRRAGPDRPRPRRSRNGNLLQEGADLGRFTSNRPGEADLDEFLEGLDNHSCASRSLIEVSTGGHITFITLNNTPNDKEYWVNRRDPKSVS